MKNYPTYLEYLAETLALDNQPPLVAASPEQILALQKTLVEELGVPLPAPYAEFLRQANGFGYNGVFFFTIDEEVNLPNLLAENKILRLQDDLLSEHLILGQSGLWYYTYHHPSSTYQALQVESLHEPCYIFEDFDDCLSSALEESLELLEEEESP